MDCVSWVARSGVLVAMTVACGPDTAQSDGESTESSTGLPSGDSSSSPEPEPETSSGAVDSTGAPESSGEESTATESSTGSSEPVETCTEGDCQRSCSHEVTVEAGEGTCECSFGSYSEMFVACELPPVCAEKGHYCLIQALRYGIGGTFEVSGAVEYKIYGSKTIEILADGRARSLDYASGHTCCEGASVEESVIENFPMPVLAVDDPFWTECLDVLPEFNDYEFPECYLQSAFATGVCDGPLDACPDVAPHEPGCDAACPMADDGVCDEPMGTGLCADGCDPIDCACPDDIPGECDELSRFGPCPLGSDADDCPGLERL